MTVPSEPPAGGSIVAEWEHGTYATYVTRKCRCDRCRQASADYIRSRRAKQDGGDYQSNRLARRATQRAMRALSERHPEEYRQILREIRLAMAREMGMAPKVDA